MTPKQSHISSPREAALMYLHRGWCPIPVPSGEKRAVLPGWPELRVTEDEIPRLFGKDVNVGLLTGEASGWLIDIDIDCPEGSEVTTAFLPPTDLVHGRPGKPASHYWYRVKAPIEFETFDDPSTAKRAKMDKAKKEKSMIVEIRANGHQTIVPPSVYTGAEYANGRDRLMWERYGEPAEVDPTELRLAVARLASCVLVARHWPAEGTRDEAAMALCGMLIRAGWSTEDVDHFVTITARLARDEEWEQRAKAAATARKLSEGHDITGAPRLAALLREGEATVALVRKWLHLDTSPGGGESCAPHRARASGRTASAEEYVPHTVEPGTTPEVIPPAPEAYQGIAGTLVRALGPCSEADEAALLSQFLVAFGNLVGRKPHVRMGGVTHHANLYMALVGPTGHGRKGTALAQVQDILREVDENWARICVHEGLSSGEGLIAAVRDRVTAPTRDGPAHGQVVEIIDPGAPDKRLLATEGELASLLQVMRREGNTVSARIRSGWDSGHLESMTRTPQRATDAHVSIIGHITREELLRCLNRTEMANGFGNRFLWIWSRRSRYLPEGGELAPQIRRNLLVKLQNAMEWARQSGALTLDERARVLWHIVYPHLSGPHSGSVLVQMITGRAEAITLRIALIYALLERSATIQLEHLMAALAVWQYAEDSARAIFGDGMGDHIADEILELLRDTPQGMTRTEIRNWFGRHYSKEIERVLSMLKNVGLVYSIMERNATGAGRPTERWFATSEPQQEASPSAATNATNATNATYPDYQVTSIAATSRVPVRYVDIGHAVSDRLAAITSGLPGPCVICGHAFDGLSAGLNWPYCADHLPTAATHDTSRQDDSQGQDDRQSDDAVA